MAIINAVIISIVIIIVKINAKSLDPVHLAVMALQHYRPA